MSLRSVFAVALLLAAVAAAQWSDVALVVVMNVSTVKVCSVSDPPSCVYTVVLNATIDPTKTFVYATDYNVETSMIPSPYTVFTEYDYTYSGEPVRVYVPESGYIWHPGNQFHVDGIAPERMRVCDADVYAVRVARGRHDIFLDPDYYLDYCTEYYDPELDGYISSCHYSPIWFTAADCSYSFMLVHDIGLTRNFVRGWAHVIIFYMPTARARGSHLGVATFNGTQHAYLVTFDAVRIPATGFYFANGTVVPTLAYYNDYDMYKFVVGPRAYDAYSYTPLVEPLYGRERTSLERFSINVYNIGPAPGDGVAVVLTPQSLYADVGVGWISNDTGGYLRVLNASLFSDKWLQIRVRRYSFVEVAVNDTLYMYSTRTIACPPYTETTAKAFVAALTRLDRAREIELCNNMTSTVYVALVYAAGSYAFIDEIQPGRCRRLKWDGAYSDEQTALEFYTSPQAFCKSQRAALRRGGQDYGAGWRYYIGGNYSLIAANPIDPDTLYAEMWKQIMQHLARLHNETINALWQWLQMQANATKRIEDYYKSLPRHIGTIKMESSTSTWLRTVLNVIAVHAVSGPPPGGGFTPAIATSSTTASAAAAAVAVAWVASRRDDDAVTTAAIAGIALAIFALLMTLIYGPTSLPLVALGIIVAAAAAAWRRI
jgi:hypothetical protein